MSPLEDLMALRDLSDPFRTKALADWAAAFTLGLPMIHVLRDREAALTEKEK